MPAIIRFASIEIVCPRSIVCNLFRIELDGLIPTKVRPRQWVDPDPFGYTTRVTAFGPLMPG